MTTHRAFVRSYLDAIEAGTAGRNVGNWYTSDAVQVEFPNKLNPNGATRTVADLQRAAHGGAQIVERQSYEITNFIEQGDRVAVECVFRATFKIDVLGLPAGQTMTARFGIFLEMRDGRIARHHTYDCIEPW